MRTTHDLLLTHAESARIRDQNAEGVATFVGLAGRDLALVLHGKQEAYEHAAQMVRDGRRAGEDDV